MTIIEFLDKQTEEKKVLFKTLNDIILKHDKSVTVEVGSIMRMKEALVYKEDNVFKYGLTAAKNHFSYHSMVMYAYPDVLEVLQKHSEGIKFQKGCFNFKTLEVIDLPTFRSFLKESTQRDFSPVIKHYKNEK